MSERSRPDDDRRCVSASRVLRFEPRPSWFVQGAGEIHGLAHEVRVLIWVQVLAEMVWQEGMSVDADVLGWAAAVHDTQRWNDGGDADHGARAADWISMNEHLLPSPVSVERVGYLCRGHVPLDHRVPEMTDELKVFKDADGLDRWRISDLDPSYLRTDSAHQLLDVSRDLWAATRELHDPSHMFTEIVTTAAELGILSAG